jgi:hypothetical protein
MCKVYRALVAAAGVGVAVIAALVVPVVAQQPAERTPTVKDPIRFEAFAVQMNAGASGVIEIAIERWSTDEERQTLVGLAGTATDKSGGQNTLLNALQKVTPRVGFIRTPNSLGWDLRYAKEFHLPDGTRQIVLATDKPVSFAAAYADSESLDYPFGLVEMQFPKDSNKGEGKLLSRTALSTKNGRLELELYGSEATRLTTITEKTK